MSRRAGARDDTIDRIIRLLPRWPVSDPARVREHLASRSEPDLVRMADALDSLRRSADDPARKRWDAVEREVRSLATLRPLLDEWDAEERVSAEFLRKWESAQSRTEISASSYVADRLELSNAPAAFQHRVYRVGKGPDAWLRSRPSRGMTQGRFGDPFGVYGTIYASSSRYGCYLEILSALRPSMLDFAPMIRRRTSQLRATPSAGQIAGDWLRGKFIGSAILSGTFLDLEDDDTRALLRRELAEVFESLQIEQFDRTALVSAPPTLTMAISRYAFDHGSRYDGIRYPSRLGTNLERWAIFERADDASCLLERLSAPVEPDDPELIAAMVVLGLMEFTDPVPAGSVRQLAASSETGLVH